MTSFVIRKMGVTDYQAIWSQMRDLTLNRDASTPDEIWVLQHYPVFTLGEGADPQHVLNPSEILVVATDRGGEVTYHGPGQVVIYPLIDLKRYKIGLRSLVRLLEDAVIDWLHQYSIEAYNDPEAPGVYVAGQKICAIGLRTHRRCVYHGLALNVAMDLEPFSRIHPCGDASLTPTQVIDWAPEVTLLDAEFGVCKTVIEKLDGGHYA